MLFMNEYEIDAATVYHRDHPTLGPAARTLSNLRDCANRNSDGWAYWPKPCRAALRLQELIQANHPLTRRYDAPEVTADQVKKAYRPIRAFLTRTGLTCEIEEPK
jgi:hypothetical protein